MTTVDVDNISLYQQTHSPSRLAWSKGWRPYGAQSAFNRRIMQTLTIAMLMMNIVDIIVALLLLLLIIMLAKN